ncbi:hypothetical protein JX266_010958 [Neoarthrinium moseri]|nr:hypothetical protein JX266_010958 [Neoarthrinium moseri]
MEVEKARVLIVGAGGVGVMAAYALEVGGKAAVTLVMRSNYRRAQDAGISIDSVDHGKGIREWRPTEIRNTIPDVSQEGIPPFDFILVTTKNIPDVPPTVADLVAPAVSPGHTAIVLSQNGLNIERPLLARFPQNPILSSVSMISTTETSPAVVVHDFADAQKIGPFVPQPAAEAAARRYVAVYNGSGRLADVVYDADVPRARWHKLVYNASFNPVAAALRMDTTRMRMSRHVIDDLVRPIMLEVVAAARAAGHVLPPDLPDALIRVDPVEAAFRPSMCQDADKCNLMEVETIVGEPVREGEARGVPMPTLRTVYGILRGLQLQTKIAKGLWEPAFDDDNPYR